MSIISKLFHRKNSPVIEQVADEASLLTATGSPFKLTVDCIKVFPSDKEIILELAGESLREWRKGILYDTHFDRYVPFVTVNLVNDDPEKLAEAARKIRAFHDLRVG